MGASAEGAASAEINDALQADPSDEIIETQANREENAAMADETAETDGWQANRHATAWDHAQMLLSDCNSTIRSKVSKHNQFEADSAVNTIDSQSSTAEGVGNQSG